MVCGLFDAYNNNIIYPNNVLTVICKCVLRNVSWTLKTVHYEEILYHSMLHVSTNRYGKALYIVKFSEERDTEFYALINMTPVDLIPVNVH